MPKSHDTLSHVNMDADLFCTGHWITESMLPVERWNVGTVGYQTKGHVLQSKSVICAYEHERARVNLVRAMRRRDEQAKEGITASGYYCACCRAI